MKRFTVIGLLAAMLVLGASFAQAAVVGPSAIRKQPWTAFGMGFSGDYHLPGQVVYNATAASSKWGGLLFNRTGADVYSVNGTLGIFNATGNTRVAKFGNSSYTGLLLDQLGPKNGVSGLLEWHGNFTGRAGALSTNDTMYIMPASDYSLMVGISNFTAGNLSSSNVEASRGVSLMVFAPMETASVTRKAKGLAGDWSVFSILTDTANKTTYRAGTLAMSADAGSAKWVGHDGYAGVSNTSSKSVSYNVGINARIFTVKNASITAPFPYMLSNATLASGNTTFVGVTSPAGTIGHVVGLTVGVKGGSVGSDSDFQNKLLKLVAAGTGRSSSSATGNATGYLAQMQVGSDLTVSSGNFTVLGDTLGATHSNHGGQTATVDMTGYSLSVGTRTMGDVQFRNVTIKDADGKAVMTFFGRWNSDKTFAVGVFNRSDTYSLGFIMPTGVASSYVGAASTAGAYWVAGNGTLGGSYTFGENEEVTMSVADMRDKCNLPASFTPLTGLKFFNASSTVLANAKIDGKSDNIYLTAAYTVTGLSGSIDDYALYKIVNATTTPYASLSTWTSRAFNRKDTWSPSIDGAWWIETGSSVLGGGSQLSPTTTYTIYSVIKNNGNYDMRADDTTGVVRVYDPQVLGTITTSSSSSSSSSGCVFNPAAGFGLEWLLLLLAPAIGIIRSRFKK